MAYRDDVNERHLRLVHSVDTPEVEVVVSQIVEMAERTGLAVQPWQRHVIDRWVNHDGGVWLDQH